ncbi:VOC family protein [Cohnella massiliensis]|uniref:VOC family protein n=1 Tax=Cohnella massiliensis TaxID=1816691 RepID=UPI0009BC0180|nr:VOC family protein [Cohnella massiliensis]
MTRKIQTIAPNLWFAHQAEEAATFYTSIFKNSGIDNVTRYGQERHETDGISEGQVMTVDFRLDGQHFVALNGGREFAFTEAISFIVHCESQEEIDYYWDKLSEGGDEKAQVCGWLKDKFGVSWQIVPANLTELVGGPDAAATNRVMKAMLQMKKLDMEALRQAYEG